jgi:hypothetical protein
VEKLTRRPSQTEATPGTRADGCCAPAPGRLGQLLTACRTRRARVGEMRRWQRAAPAAGGMGLVASIGRSPVRRLGGAQGGGRWGEPVRRRRLGVGKPWSRTRRDSGGKGDGCGLPRSRSHRPQGARVGERRGMVACLAWASSRQGGKVLRNLRPSNVDS